MERPIPTQNQIALDPNKVIMSKTDLKGIIEYANDYFVEVCKYSKAELMGTNHNIIRHPDMPKAVFKLMWDRISSGKSIMALVKNLTKNGDYYWVVAKIEPRFDESGKIDSYFSQRKAAPEAAIKKIEKFYKSLLEIESINKLEVSEKYLKGLLEEHNMSYDDFVLHILGMDQKTLTEYFDGVKSINPEIDQKKSKRPTPTNEEVKLDPSKTIMSKTDLKGVIEYANEYFIEVCGYPREELMGKPHNIIRHPDMPKLVFKIMWDRLKRGEGLYAIVKNLTKSGAHYWVIARIDPKFDENGNIDSYYSYRKAVPQSAVRKIEQYYRVLTSIEKEQSPEAAEHYFKGLLEEKNFTYDEFILKVLEKDQKTLDNYFIEANTVKVHSEVSSSVKKFNKPIPGNKEVVLDPTKIIMSKTNAKGVIEYANDYFVEVSGYEEYELMGEPHNIVRHPDMPRTVFKLLWETIRQGKNIHALVKNLCKDGRYYWVLTNFETKYNENNEIVSYYSRRKAAPKEAVYEVEKLYNTLLNIEQKQGMQVAYNFFVGMLEEKKITYDDFIMRILGMTPKEIKMYFEEEEEQQHDVQTEQERKSFFRRVFSN